jgi:hypothetical protein
LLYKISGILLLFGVEGTILMSKAKGTVMLYGLGGTVTLCKGEGIVMLYEGEGTVVLSSVRIMELLKLTPARSNLLPVRLTPSYVTGRGVRKERSEKLKARSDDK